jgi:hypothetical protein
MTHSSWRGTVNPPLVIKGEQADLALELMASRRNHGRRGYPPEEKARRVALAARVSALNRRGSLPRGRTPRAGVPAR